MIILKCISVIALCVIWFCAGYQVGIARERLETNKILDDIFNELLKVKEAFKEVSHETK